MTDRRMSSKDSITADERLQLIGLVTIAWQLESDIQRVRHLALTLTGELDHEGKPDEHGHTGDTLWSPRHHGDAAGSVDWLLDRLGLTVYTPMQAVTLADVEQLSELVRLIAEHAHLGKPEELSAEGIIARVMQGIDRAGYTVTRKEPTDQ